MTMVTNASPKAGTKPNRQQRRQAARLAKGARRGNGAAALHFSEHVQKGAQLHQAGQVQEAEAIYRRVLDINPNHADANHLRGVLLFQVGNHAQAVELISRAIAMAPDQPIYHNNLGAVLKELGRPDDALASYRRALAIKPDYGEAHDNLGIVLADSGRLEEAVASYHKALAIKPDHAETHNNLGIALASSGRLDDAVASYGRALALRPDVAEAHRNLGNVLQKLGRPDDALASYERAIAVKPDFAEAHRNLGTVLANSGRTEEAVASFRRALEFDPADTSALHMVASLSGETTKIAPRAYVRKLFDDYAARFDDHLVGKLDYKIPELMRRVVDCATDNRGRFGRALDLGCGTGLVGENFKDIVEQIHGVDLSPKMIECAGRKDIYSALHLADVLEFLESSDSKASDYDLILAADVFVYIGDLAPVFAAIGRALTEGGLFVFSVESLEQGSYKLRPTGRYAHSDACISGLASDCGFAVELCEGVDLRKERDGRVAGNLYILRGGGLVADLP